MSFHAYRGNAFDHTHENKAFNQLYDLLANIWSERDEPLHLLGNFFVDGRDFDALIIKRNAIIVIDFKDYGGALQFSENGHWRIDGREVRGGSKTNPFHQIRDNKYLLLAYLKREVVFQSSPDFGHIAGLCLFHRAIDFDSEQLRGSVSRWFHISDMEHVARDIEAVVSKSINLTSNDMHALLVRLNVPAYTPDGQPTVVDLTPEAIESDDEIHWTSEQQSALNQLSVWLSGEEYPVQIIQGAAHTGKRKVLQEALRKLVAAGLSPVLIAPNARLANAYKDLGFSDCQSIYSWLYAGRPSEFKNNQAIYPVNLDLPDPNLEVLVFVEAHLLGDEKYSRDTMIFGSGYLLQDLFNVLTGLPKGEEASQAALPLQKLPKMILMGDPYQLTRGSLKKSFIGGQIFEQRDIKFDYFELQGQIRLNDGQEEKLDFQSVLVKALGAAKFVRLPSARGGSICEIVKGVKSDHIAKELIRWPKQSIMLCATNEQVYKTNKSIRKKYLAAQAMEQLVVGDIVNFHNRTPNLLVTDPILGEQVWVSSGEFAKVIGVGKSFTRSINLKGRDSEVTLAFAMAKVLLSSGMEVEISYLPDYLAAEKPDLSPDQMIALQIWAREDADLKLASEKEELQQLKEQESDNYKEKKSQFDQRFLMLIMYSPILNAARLRYAYVLTVHRAQTYLPFSNVILNATMSHDTENHATDSYFRWLYTATVCTADTMWLLDYPILTPLSKAEWKVGEAKISPWVIKKRFYYDKSRTPSSADLAQSIPDGASFPDPELLALYLTVREQLQECSWEVQSITHNQYFERYLFIGEGSKIVIDLKYNGKFEVTVGTSNILEGSDDHQVDLFELLKTPPIFVDENISLVVNEFSRLMVSRGWSVAATYEKNYKVFVDLVNDKGNIKVEINVPSKGVVSSIKLQQVSSQDLVDHFAKEFING